MRPLPLLFPAYRGSKVPLWQVRTVLTVYSALFGTGYLLYGSLPTALACFAVFVIASVSLLRLLPRVGFIE